jgi:Ulp1 family protease
VGNGTLSKVEDLAKKVSGIAEPTIEQELGTPAQGNGSDCGVYVCAITEKLVEKYLDASTPMV